MSFIPKFSIGDRLTNDEIRTSFQCGNMGGMRRSRVTNTLVIISDHTKGLYEDKWYCDVLHYTGMGKIGNQSLGFMQNKTLAESNNNGVDIHLFEVLLPSQYIYRGQVYLIESPYQEIQPGEDGVNRKVWMFPVKLKVQSQSIDNNIFEIYTKSKQKKARKLSDEDLKKRALQGESNEVSQRNVTSSTYVRDEYVAEYTKRRANGVCQLCGAPAPFKDKDAKPYLECHHIDWLSLGGTDTIDNTVALCPNCHKKMHVLNLDSEKALLKQKASK